MAKSSRSKWKKLHRRQRAQAEVKNTVKRVSKLHHKLKLTAKGGISLVPPQEPEKRFHFTNPDKNLRVPDPRREYNNDYQLDKTVRDFTKPLHLPPPTTNVYGKSDIHAPHPMTRNYEVIDADAPIAGHAMTKKDLERSIRKAQEAALQQNEESSVITSSVGNAVPEEELSDGPEEYVFGIEDSAPKKVSKNSAKKSSSAAAKLSQRSSSMAENEEDEGKRANKRIKSMSDNHKINNIVVSTSGTAKVKKMGGMSGSAAARVKSSGSKSNKKKK